ncbi:hypothetical protein EJ06DRAFT_556311 [Trichodelitschia bisporula]|uniref:CsbD-like domain-containing protein n=1 Tax=Trichodelitschia bisporula TaxID=703511 RepID=A0A6G1HXS4_9PEZI|nr:hypothetical protein EJ06DRAFT_556311 [Trichodelitschia bisporula]
MSAAHDTMDPPSPGSHPTEDAESFQPLKTESSHSTTPYSNATQHGSGTTAGAGYGNKTGEHAAAKADSMLGRVMQKAGSVVHNEGLIEKGTERRKSAGWKEEEAAAK